MFITLVGDMTAFASLVFGYFFYWTIHADFPPESMPGPGLLWPALAGAALLGAWLLTLLARRWNAREARNAFRGALVGAVALAVAGMGALLAGPWRGGLDPTAHVYPAIVWTCVIWVGLHAGNGIVKQLYCLARSLAGRLTAAYDIDIQNVTLYWHFLAVTVVVAVGVIAGFPQVA
jgi:cytochrome c oxidase subunit I+III